MRMIDADDMISFPYSEGAGTEEQIMDWIEECGLSDEEDKAKMLCWKVIEGFRNVVKTAPTIPAPQWISVEDRLPEDAGDVLVVAFWHEKYQVLTGWHSLGGWLVTAGNEERPLDVTHWMPLPTNPKDGGE